MGLIQSAMGDLNKKHIILCFIKLCQGLIRMNIFVTFLTQCFAPLFFFLLSRAVHESGQVGFGPDPDSTRLNRVTKITTRNRPDIWDRPGGSGHQLIGSDWSVWRVWAWASIWAEFVILHKFFLTQFLSGLLGPN